MKEVEGQNWYESGEPWGKHQEISSQMLVILKIVLWVLGRLNLHKESIVDLMESSGLLSSLLAENTIWDVHIYIPALVESLVWKEGVRLDWSNGAGEINFTAKSLVASTHVFYCGDREWSELREYGCFGGSWAELPHPGHYFENSVWVFELVADWEMICTDFISSPGHSSLQYFSLKPQGKKRKREKHFSVGTAHDASDTTDRPGGPRIPLPTS